MSDFPTVHSVPEISELLPNGLRDGEWQRMAIEHVSWRLGMGIPESTELIDTLFAMLEDVCHVEFHATNYDLADQVPEEIIRPFCEVEMALHDRDPALYNRIFDQTDWKYPR